MLRKTALFSICFFVLVSAVALGQNPPESVTPDDTSSISIPLSPAPAPPGNLVVRDNPSDGGGKIMVRWDLSADDGSGKNNVLGYEVMRLIGVEATRGFFTFYARFDLGQVLDLCWRIGATRDDARVDEIVTFIQSLQGEYGLWDAADHPEASRWVTYDLLYSLSRLDTQGEWASAEPRTPFQTYPKAQRRY